MLDNIQQAFRDYTDQIPNHALRGIGLSAVASFTASVLIATLKAEYNQPVNFSRAYMATTIAVIASTIHALTNPLFNYLFNNTVNEYNGFQDLIHTFMDITLTHLLINHATAYKVNLMTTLVPSGDNYIILSHTALLKQSADMVARGALLFVSFFQPQAQANVPQFRQDIFAEFGLDPSQTNPVYLAI